MKKLLLLPLLLLTLTLSSSALKKDYSTITVTASEIFCAGWDTEETNISNDSLLNIYWDVTRAVIFDNNKLMEIDVEDWKPYGSSDIEIKSVKGKIYVKSLKDVILLGD